MQISRRQAAALMGAPLLSPLLGRAQDAWPSKPVKIIVSNTAGGAPDVIARHMGARLSTLWSTPVVIENRPGGGSSIGSDYAARQAPDGYTLLMSGIASHAINPALYKNIAYDPIKDFTAISLVGTLANALLVAPSFPASSLQEFIAVVKAAPGKYAYGSPGNGSSPHLAGELLCQMAGLTMVHVPYGGSPESLKDLLGGQISVSFDTLTSVVLPSLKAGKIRALGVTTSTRSSVMPELRTFSESGVPGYDVTPWAALYGPARMPMAVTRRINADVKTVLEEQATIEKLASLGITARYMPQAEMDKFFLAEVEKYRKLVQAANLKIG